MGGIELTESPDAVVQELIMNIQEMEENYDVMTRITGGYVYLFLRHFACGNR